MMWFLGALGLSAVVLFIGWLLSLKRKPKPEPEHLWSREYKQIYRSCLDYVEQLYQPK